MKGHSFYRSPCSYCGRLTSACGFGRVAHLRKHVRQGMLIEQVRHGRTRTGRQTTERAFNETPSGTAARQRFCAHLLERLRTDYVTNTGSSDALLTMRLPLEL